MRKLKWFLVGIVAFLAISYLAYGAGTMTFRGQTFQVPDFWPSEVEMKALPMIKMIKGSLTEYVFKQEMTPGYTLYWFIGTKTNSRFTTKLLTQTWVLTGTGILKCDHWIVNSDGTITKISCEKFGKITSDLIEGSSI